MAAATFSVERTTAARMPRQREVPFAGQTARKVDGPLLVATDASSAADAALRAAYLISARTEQVVRLIAVHEPMPLVSTEVQVAETPDIEAEYCDALRLEVREQLSRMGIMEDWPLEVASGDPAAVIARAAQAYDAAFVIMGLGEHGLLERVLGDETVIKLLRIGTVPVLAVSHDFRTLPARVLAAVDFSPSSVHALSVAMEIMHPSGKLTLAHVASRQADAANWSTPRSGYQGTIGRAFDLVSAELSPPAGLDVERKILVGDPSKALLDYSEKNSSDLIVAGSHGHGFLTRLLVGSVSQKLVRGARCSVFVAPPELGTSFMDEVPELTTRFAAYEWAERLEEFTRRNRGRIATLEVIDPEIGAQVEEQGFPFMGAAFDPRDAHVQLFLGTDKPERHLTRNIHHVTAVQVLRNRTGRDLMLRVAHGRGQTLLTLER
jgi:nucleotide-binding universal stress UspA family protein